MHITIRDVRAADHAWIVAVNDAAVPAVSAFAPLDLAGYFAMAAWARIAEADGERLGLASAFLPGRPYDCENYLWFARHSADFLYIDRIVVAPAAHGSGIGRRLYADAEAFARGRAGRLACEVNECPPNPRSLRFHERWGFRPVGRQSTEGGAKRVILMEKPMAA